MRSILLTLFILLSSLLFSQARTGVYASNGYMSYRFDSVSNNYIAINHEAKKILIFLNKEDIEYRGLNAIKQDIVFDQISGDDEAFIYYTRNSKIIIQREIEFIFILSNMENGEYQSMISLMNTFYMVKIELYEFQSID